MKVYQQIAQSFIASRNCISNENYEWKGKHEEKIDTIVSDYLPRGSGVDDYPVFDYVESNKEKLVFRAGYHHMDENGYYDGWTECKVVVRPSFHGIDLKIQGQFPRKYAETRAYLAEIFYDALTTEYTPKQ